MIYSHALIGDLLGAPEFILGAVIAKKFREKVPGWKQSPTKIIFAALVFLAAGLCGTLLRTVILGTPFPGFISFGFGFAVIYPFN